MQILEMIQSMLQDLGLLFLRIGVGGSMLFFHGWDKFTRYFDPAFDASQFPDPIGLGSALGYALVTASEFLFSVLILVGVLTRASSVPLFIAMFVAAFVHHASDPWEKRELALVYMFGAAALICLGGGKFAAVRSKSFILS